MEDISFIEKEKEEIRELILKMSREETGLKTIKETGVLRRLVEVFAKVVTLVYGSFIDVIYKQSLVKTASKEFLDSHASLVGVSRKGGEKTRGVVCFDCYASNGSIKKDLILRSEKTGLEYKIVKDYSFSLGQNKIEVEAVDIGSKYNLKGGVKFRLEKNILGIDSGGFYTEEDWISEYGEDKEEDELLRERVLRRWKSLGIDNTLSKYEYVATSLPYVKYAKAIRTPRGLGSVDLFIYTDLQSKQDYLKKEIEKALKDNLLYLRGLNIVYTGLREVDLEIKFKLKPLHDLSLTSLVKAKIEDYINSLKIGEGLNLSSLYRESFWGKEFDIDAFSISDIKETPSEVEKLIPGKIEVISYD